MPAPPAPPSRRWSVPDRIERAALNGVDLDLSTLADLVGAAAAVLTLLHELIRQHVLGAERLHGDDTTVPALAKGKTVTGRPSRVQ